LAQQTTDIASLKARLDQAAAELSASRSEVESLKNDLSRAAQSQGALGDRLERLQTTYDELIRKYEALSTSFSRYRSEMTGQIQSLQSERDAAVRSGRLARTAAIAELVLLLALGGAMAVGSLQLR
jgi:archaellum component FlaC